MTKHPTIDLLSEHHGRIRATLHPDGLNLAFRLEEGRALTQVLSFPAEDTAALRDLLAPGHAELLAALEAERAKTAWLQAYGRNTWGDDWWPGSEDHARERAAAGVLAPLPADFRGYADADGPRPHRPQPPRNTVIEFHYDDGDVGAHPVEPDDMPHVAKLWAGFASGDQKPAHIVLRPAETDE